MMDHIKLKSKDPDEPCRDEMPEVDTRDEDTSGSYYYDDSTNYALYREGDDEEDPLSDKSSTESDL